MNSQPVTGDKAVSCRRARPRSVLAWIGGDTGPCWRQWRDEGQVLRHTRWGWAQVSCSLSSTCLLRGGAQWGGRRRCCCWSVVPPPPQHLSAGSGGGSLALPAWEKGPGRQVCPDSELLPSGTASGFSVVM